MTNQERIKEIYAKYPPNSLLRDLSPADQEEVAKLKSGQGQDIINKLMQGRETPAAGKIPDKVPRYGEVPKVPGFDMGSSSSQNSSPNPLTGQSSSANLKKGTSTSSSNTLPKSTSSASASSVSSKQTSKNQSLSSKAAGSSSSTPKVTDVLPPKDETLSNIPAAASTDIPRYDANGDFTKEFRDQLLWEMKAEGVELEDRGEWLENNSPNFATERKEAMGGVPRELKRDQQNMEEAERTTPNAQPAEDTRKPYSLEGRDFKKEFHDQLVQNKFNAKYDPIQMFDYAFDENAKILKNSKIAKLPAPNPDGTDPHIDKLLNHLGNTLLNAAQPRMSEDIADPRMSEDLTETLMVNGILSSTVIHQLEDSRGPLPEGIKQRIKTAAKVDLPNPNFDKGMSLLGTTIKEYYNQKQPKVLSGSSAGGEVATVAPSETITETTFEPAPQDQMEFVPDQRPDFNFTPDQGTYLDPLRKSVGDFFAASNSDPYASNPVLNRGIREDLLSGKEDSKNQYVTALKELLEKSEGKALTKNLVRAIGELTAGLVGLNTGLNVGGNYKAGPLSTPDEYFNQIKPALDAAHEQEMGKFDDLTAHWQKAGDYYAQGPKLYADLAQAEYILSQANLSRLKAEADLYKDMYGKDGTFNAETAKKAGELKNALVHYEAEETAAREQVKTVQSEIREALKPLQEISKDPVAKANVDAVRKVYESKALGGIQDPIEQWKAVSEILRVGGYTGNFEKLNQLQASGASTMQILNAVTLANSDAGAIFAPLFSGTIDADQSEKLTEYMNAVDAVNSQPLYDKQGYVVLAKDLASAKERYANAINQRAAAMQQYSTEMQGAPKGRWTTRTFTRAQPQIRSTKTVSLRAPEVIAGEANDIAFVNPPGGGRRDMSGTSVPGTINEQVLPLHGVSTKNLDRGVLTASGEYYAPTHLVQDPPFFDKMKQMGDKYKVDPYGMLYFMHLETGGSFNPAVVNPNGGATGMIQFMPKTASGMLKNLHDGNGNPIDVAQFAADVPNLSPLQANRLGAQRYMASLSRNEQMEFVEDYLDQSLKEARWTGKQLTPGHLYALVLMGSGGVRTGWRKKDLYESNNPGIFAKASRDGKTMSAEDLALYINSTPLKTVKPKQGAQIANPVDVNEIMAAADSFAEEDASEEEAAYAQ